MTKEDVKRSSMTPGCKGCISVNRGSQAVNHSESCRTRITEELDKEDDERVKTPKEQERG